MKRRSSKRADYEEAGRYEKIRRKRGAAKGADELREAFEKPQDEWDTTEGCFAARVVEVHKRYAFVSPEPERGKIQTRDVWLATVARKFLVARRVERNLVCVGDRVLCQPTAEAMTEDVSDLPRSLILHAAPRATKISRVDPTDAGREHVLASNMDQILVVASFLNPKVRWGLVDRYLVLAEIEGIKPLIVLNKRDLLAAEGDSEFAVETRGRLAVYRRLGYEVFEVQANAPNAAKDPQIQALRFDLKGKVSLVTGHSGVGKSSLVNLFKPELEQAVEEDANIFYKGRHTTSYASLIKLGTGGFIIDTPGIRSFSIGQWDAFQLTHGFVEMRPLLGKCRYPACQHVEEPECAVKNAVEEGQIEAWRYRSYLGLLLGETGREGRTREIDLEE